MTTDAAGQREPDGRPLYAYKWHDASYERLKTTVRTQFPEALRGTATHRFAAMFCVYAAETFRRRHAGGPWTWETVFAEIGYATPAEQLLYVWVAKGGVPVVLEQKTTIRCNHLLFHGRTTMPGQKRREGVPSQCMNTILKS